jgi:hypothetical protein
MGRLHAAWLLRVSMYWSATAALLLHELKFLHDGLEDGCETLQGALHVAQHLSETGARLLRGWRVLLERSWSGKVACAGEFVGIQPVIGIEVQPPGADGPL